MTDLDGLVRVARDVASRHGAEGGDVGAHTVALAVLETAEEVKALRAELAEVRSSATAEVDLADLAVIEARVAADKRVLDAVEAAVGEIRWLNHITPAARELVAAWDGRRALSDDTGETSTVDGGAWEHWGPLLKARVRFWTCPVNHPGPWRLSEVRQTVEWRGDVAHCLEPGCGKTSADVMPEPCQPIGCGNGYHLPGCTFAAVDADVAVDARRARGESAPRPSPEQQGDHVTVTDERLSEIAEAAIADAIADLAHDRMGQSEMLEDELEGLSEEEQEAVMDRLEAFFREPQPTRRSMLEVLATMRGLEVAEKAGGRYLSALAYNGAAELLDAALNPPGDEDEDDD